MDFEGRLDLVNTSINYFEDYNSTFMNNIRKYYKDECLNFNNEIEKIFEELYSMLLIKNFDIEKAKELVRNNNFNRACLFESLLTCQIDYAKHVNTNKLDLKLLQYILNALNRYRMIFSNSINNTFNEVSNNVNIFLGGSSGFMIHENYIDTFNKMHKLNEKIEFLNLFNGVPIRNYGEIIKVEENQIIVKINLTQILAMKNEENAYIIKNQYIHNNLKANILWVNISDCTVCLNEFEVQNVMHALKRKYPRVHPDKFTRITLYHDDGRSLNGKLFDISEGGIGVVSMENADFKSGDLLSADISLTMPGSETNIRLNLYFRLVVVIVYQNAYRYCLEILPDQMDIEKIQQFAKYRVEETLLELQEQLKLYKRD